MWQQGRDEHTSFWDLSADGAIVSIILGNIVGNVGFEIVTAAIMKHSIFGWVTPCILVVHRRFKGTYYLHLQVRSVSWPSHSKKQAASRTVSCRSQWRRGLSNTGNMGSNPTQGMDVCLRLFCVCIVLCVGSGFATGSSPVQGVLPTILDQETEAKRSVSRMPCASSGSNRNKNKETEEVVSWLITYYVN
jgi:hypothetical protein